jgi:hypothetical protein
LELLFDVCQNCPVAVSLQSLVNESAQHHLETHGPLELGRGRSRENPSPVHDLLGNGKQNAGLILEHRHLPVLPARSTVTAIDRLSREPTHIHFIIHITYITYCIMNSKGILSEAVCGSVARQKGTSDAG